MGRTGQRRRGEKGTVAGCIGETPARKCHLAAQSRRTPLTVCAQQERVSHAHETLLVFPKAQEQWLLCMKINTRNENVKREKIIWSETWRERIALNQPVLICPFSLAEAAL